jgi:hypothetical protein
MFPHLTRRTALLTAFGGCLLLFLAIGAALKLTREVRRTLAAPVGHSAPLAFLPVAEPTVQVDRWGGGAVRGVVVTPEALITAGTFGVRDDRGDLGRSLPTLQASALALWRGTPLVALDAGGLFLRRNGVWEELRTGFGTLHQGNRRSQVTGWHLCGHSILSRFTVHKAAAQPNPPLNSAPACIAFRSFSSFRFLGLALGLLSALVSHQQRTDLRR